MTDIPLTRSKHLLPFSLLLEKTGEPVRPLLSQSRLPVDCIDDPQTLIPSSRAFRFRSLAARRLGRVDLALEATRDLKVADLGSFAAPFFRAPTLFQLLTSFRHRVNTETTMTVFHMHANDAGDVSFFHRFHHASKKDIWQSDLYTLQWMLKIVQLVAPHWSPEEIWSLSPVGENQHQTLEMLGAKSTAFARPGTGFVIPHAMLALPLHCRNLNAKGGDGNQSRVPKADPAETLSGAIGQLLRSYSTDHWLAIEEIAELVAMSTRTLQRRLSEERMTFRAVFDTTRSEMAGEFLETTDMTMAEIASQLGYENQANLTRAFKRWSGVAPSVYRRQRVGSEQ